MKVKLKQEYKDLGYQLRRFDGPYGRHTEDYEVVKWFDKAIKLEGDKEKRMYHICAEVYHIGKNDNDSDNVGNSGNSRYIGKIVNPKMIEESFGGDKEKIKQFYDDLNLAIAKLK